MGSLPRNLPRSVATNLRSDRTAATARSRRLFRQLADEMGATVLIIEHIIDVVADACDELIVLDFGRVIGGATRDVFACELERAAHLGTATEPGLLDDHQNMTYSAIFHALRETDPSIRLASPRRADARVRGECQCPAGSTSTSSTRT